MQQEGSEQGDQQSLLEREAALRRRLESSRQAEKLQITKNMVLWCLEQYGARTRKYRDCATHGASHGLLHAKMESVHYDEYFEQALSELSASNLIWCRKKSVVFGAG